MTARPTTYQYPMLDRPPLSLALAALRNPGEADRPRRGLELAAGAGFRWVTLDGGAPGLRPRELDRSARRDLAALLRRLELGLAGVDLWIPPDHFAEPEHADRAVAAVVGAVDLVADLADLSGGERIVSVTLPRERGVAAAAIDAMATRADERATLIADHTWPPPESASPAPIAVGLDPAACLLAGDNPAKAAARLGGRLALARLSDASDVTRVAPGGRDGRLNDLAYVVALETAKMSRPLVLDLRGTPAPAESAPRVLAWWTDA